MNTGNLQEISDRTIPIHSPLKRDEIQPKYRMFHDEGELQHQEEEEEGKKEGGCCGCAWVLIIVAGVIFAVWWFGWAGSFWEWVTKVICGLCA